MVPPPRSRNFVVRGQNLQVLLTSAVPILHRDLAVDLHNESLLPYWSHRFPEIVVGSDRSIVVGPCCL